MLKRDLVIAPVGEAALILAVAAAGWAAHQPLVFTSLGPTAYELVERPFRRSAHPWSILVGHATGIAAGFLALAATGAWHAPVVSALGVPEPRMWAAALATALTVLGNLLFRASQPAALSTTLLVVLGTMQRPRDAAILLGGVVLITLIGDPVRQLRLRTPELRKDPDSPAT